MKQESVVFDTNAYRNFVHDLDESAIRERIRELVICEKKCNVTVDVSVPVLVELFNHLADRSDPAYDICRRGSIAAWEHAIGHSKTGQISIVPEGILLISRALFPKAEKSAAFLEREANNIALAGVLKAVGESTVNDDLSSWQKAFNKLKLYVASEEKNFIEHMREVVFKLDPATPNWRIYGNDKVKRREFLQELRSVKGLEWIAWSYAVYAFELVFTRKPNQEDLSSYVQDLIRLFRAPLEVYRGILVLLAGFGFSMEDPKKRRENFRWDIDILFGLSLETLSGKHITLVTGDEKMLDAASEANLGDRAQRLFDYLQRIGL